MKTRRMTVGERLQLVGMGLALCLGPLAGIVMILAAIPVIGWPFLRLLERFGFGR